MRSRAADGGPVYRGPPPDQPSLFAERRLPPAAPRKGDKGAYNALHSASHAIASWFLSLLCGRRRVNSYSWWLGPSQAYAEARDMLVAVRDNVARLKKQGRSIDEIVAARPTAAFDARWGQFVIDPAFFTRLAHQGV
jgi:hypothetical protein